jgi:hypothetical protein
MKEVLVSWACSMYGIKELQIIVDSETSRKNKFNNFYTLMVIWNLKE